MSTEVPSEAGVPASPVSRYDEHYRSGGFGYEANRQRWEDWVREHYVRAFDFPSGCEILDVPCGDGFWSSILQGIGFHVTGLDLSVGGIETARVRYPHIRFEVADAERDLPVPTEGFEVVFCRGITHLHRTELVTASSTTMIRSLMRHVAPGGLLLVSYSTKRDGSIDVPGAKRHHPVSELVALCERAGDVTRVEVVDNFVQIGVERRDAPRRRRRSLRRYLTPWRIAAGINRRVDRLRKRRLKRLRSEVG